MSRHFLIDGYNVLHKMPGLAPQTGMSLEDGRDGLVRFITERRPHGSLRNAVTLVFDGSESVCSLNIPGEVRVLFSRGEDADCLIKRLIEEAPNPRELVMVSDDRELQHYARAYAAEVWGVARFVEQGHRQSRPAATKNRGPEGRTDDKVIGEVFKARVNRELERTWLNRKKQ